MHPLVSNYSAHDAALVLVLAVEPICLCIVFCIDLKLMPFILSKIYPLQTGLVDEQKC